MTSGIGGGRAIRRWRLALARLDRRYPSAGSWLMVAAIVVGTVGWIGTTAGHRAAYLQVAAEAAALSAAAAEPAMALRRVTDAVSAAGLDASAGVKVVRGRVERGRFHPDETGDAVRVVLHGYPALPGLRSLGLPVPSLRARAVGRRIGGAVVEIGPRLAPLSESGRRVLLGLLGAPRNGDLGQVAAMLGQQDSRTENGGDLADAVVSPAAVAEALRRLLPDGIRAGAVTVPRMLEAIAMALPVEATTARAALAALGEATAEASRTVHSADVLDPEAVRRAVRPVPVVDLLAAVARATLFAGPATLAVDRPADGLTAIDVTVALEAAGRSPWIALRQAHDGAAVAPGAIIGLTARVAVSDVPGVREMAVPAVVVVDPAGMALGTVECGSAPSVRATVDGPGALVRFGGSPPTPDGSNDRADGRGAERDGGGRPAVLFDGPAVRGWISGDTALRPPRPAERTVTPTAVAMLQADRMHAPVGLPDVMARLVAGADVTVGVDRGSGMPEAALRNEAIGAVRHAGPALIALTGEILSILHLSPGGFVMRVHDTRCDASDLVNAPDAPAARR